jgi:hypothetical protein
MMMIRVRQKKLGELIAHVQKKVLGLRVDEELLFFSCRRFAFHLPR